MTKTTNPLDGLVKSCTAFRDFEDMKHSMEEHGYVPTLNASAAARELASKLRFIGYRVVE